MKKILDNTTIIKGDVPTPAQKNFLMNLWNQEYPARLAFKTISDLDSYLGGLKKPLHYFAENENKYHIAWAASFEREGERWFAMIIDNEYHRAGLGTLLLEFLRKNETELSGWVIDHDTELKLNGQTYNSPLTFYLKNNFVVFKETRLETDKLSAVKIKWNLNQNA